MDERGHGATLTVDQLEELDLLEVEPIRELMEQLLQLGAPDFLAGEEYEGVVLEASWPDKKIAIVPTGWTDSVPTDWTVTPVDEADADEMLLALKGNE